MTEKQRVKRRWWVGVALAVIGMLAAAPILSASGQVTGQLAAVKVEGSTGDSDGDTRTVSIRFGVKNEGLVPVTIVGAGRSSSFMRLLDIEDMPIPMTLGPGQTAAVRLVYKVIDCDGVPAEEWPIPLSVKRPWGTQTVYVDPSPQEPDTSNPHVPEDYENSSWTLWHGAAVSFVCDWRSDDEPGTSKTG